jgi:hypothetical protein
VTRFDRNARFGSLDQSLRAPALIHSSIDVICSLESGGPPSGICDPHGGFASETF